MHFVEIHWCSQNSSLAPMAIQWKTSSPWAPWQGLIQAYPEADHQGRWKQSHQRCGLGLWALTVGNSLHPFLWLGGKLYIWHSCTVFKFPGWVELAGHCIWTNANHPVSLFYVILMNRQLASLISLLQANDRFCSQAHDVVGDDSGLP